MPWRSRKLLKVVAGAAVSRMLTIPLIRLDPFHTQFSETEDAQYFEAMEKSALPDVEGQVLVMAWNIKFGGARIDFWFDGHDDRVHMDEEEVRVNLSGVAEKIRQVDPDILLIQEVDIDSKRCAFIDQMQWILDHTGLNYGVYASQWRASFVPADGIGRVDMGNAIFSKFPIEDAQRLSLPQMETQDRLTRYFYLKRNILTARVRIPGREAVHVINTHAEAFSKDGTKKKQIDHFFEELCRIDQGGGLFVAGGDLNALPPGTRQQYQFEDVVSEDEDFQASDYRGESDWLEQFYDSFTPAVSLENYQRDNRPHFTHSTSGATFWNRKLDYLFTNGRFKEGTVLTHQDESSGGMETMPLSDHAPITAALMVEKYVEDCGEIDE